MPKFKEVNFWLIYFIISAVIILISSLTFYSEWNSTKNKYIEQISNINRITLQNTLSAFHFQESTLKILGKNLLSIDAYNYPEFGRKTVEEMIEVNKGLVAFGLAKYNGQLILVSNIPAGKKLPNLMQNEKSRESFKIARESTNKMQLGRTYLLKASNSWGMPIRMAILNKHGEIPLVMTAGIRVDGGDTALNVKELPKDTLVQVVRKDGYIQFQNPIAKNDYAKVYNQLFDKEVFNKLQALSNDILIFDSHLTGKDSLSSALYMQEYDLYTVVSMPYEKIYAEYYEKLILWIVLLLLLLFGLYLIFRHSINLQTVAANRLKYMARHDSLTNLPNRLALQEEIEERIANQENFYVLFLDLDNFKHINDTYGHTLGDELLKIVASRLRTKLFEGDYMARQGGDEFILLVSEHQGEPIRNLAKTILNIFLEPIFIQNNELYSGTSIGISRNEHKHENASDILNKADIALYKAKENKNAYVFFSEELYKDSKHYIQVESKLRQAIKKEELYLVYQPKIDATTLEITGVEALLRWENDYLGFVSPELFIPIAEKSGLINEIGSFVIQKAQSDVLEIWGTTKKQFKLSVNVSPRQLVSQKDRKHFKKLIKSDVFPKDYFIIEVTENVFISETQKTIAFLDKVRSLGIGVSLDDFGTGFSSLSILSKLPLTELKVDKSFVQNMLLDNENMMLVKSIINIGKNMHLKVVAEGVETKEELQILQEMGCEIYQGYYFSKPLKKEELISYLTSKN